MIKLPSKKPEGIIELTYSQIDILLKFATISKKDIFYDLGCGRGKIVLQAFEKYNVKKAVGFEMQKALYKIAKRKIQKYSKNSRIKFILGDFTYVNDLDNRCMFDFSDATVVFNSLEPNKDENELYMTQFRGKKNVKILKKDLPLVGYRPAAVNNEDEGFWFFLIKTPLSKYRIHSKKKWAQYVLQDEKATLSKVYKYFRNQLRKRKASKKERDESIKYLKKEVKSLLTRN